LPMLQLLRNASAIEKERYCQFILEGDTDSINLLLQTSCAGALEASLQAGAERLRQARQHLDELPSTLAVAALHGLTDTIGAMLRSLREPNA
jgi:hypothetical protein